MDVSAIDLATGLRVPIDNGGTLLTDIATLGFYTFNVDIYVDTDRVPGSGRTAMLPGRKAEVDPASAWEKAISTWCRRGRTRWLQAPTRSLGC